MDKHKLVLPISILLGCIILGGFFYASQVNKQQSIERQQQIELQAKAEADRLKINTDQAQQDAIKQAEANKQLDLSFCLDKADTDYWAYMKLNGTTKADKTIWAENSIWDRAGKDKQIAIDNCYKQYK